MKYNLQNFLAEILDQSWEMPSGGKVVWLADVVTAEQRIEAELREIEKNSSDVLQHHSDSLRKCEAATIRERIRFIDKEILGE